MSVPDINGNRSLNWGRGADRKGTVLPKGSGRKCVTCREWTVLLNPDGIPQHKVCAEIEAGLRTEQQ